MMGFTPAPISVGIMMAPTAAPQPAALGSAMLMRNVTITVPGIRITRNFPRAPASKCTRCASHLVSFMTNAKPMTVQMTGTRPVLTIAALKAVTASMGLPDNAAMTTPDKNSTSLVSYFLIIAAKVNNTIIAPTQTKGIPPHYFVTLGIRLTLCIFLRTKIKNDDRNFFSL